MSDMFLGSQTPMYQNVRICKRNKNGKILEERYAKNRVTRLMLYGIGKFLLGHFNNSSPDKIYEFIPRYLALGTNTPGLDVNTAGVTTLSSVEDTRLLNEITKSSTLGTSETVKRIWIAERNMCKLNTKFSDPFIKVSIKTYVSSNHYDGIAIGEAGLFSKEKNNNCLARVCFSPITKNPGEVLDIQWDITLLSYGETKYPEKLEIENGSKISIPLRYTNKKFIEYDLGLKKYPLYNSIGRDAFEDMFEYDANGNITTSYSLEEIKDKSGWYEYLTTIGLEDKFEMFYNLLISSKLNDASNDGRNARFLYSIDSNIPNMFYFGNLRVNLNDINNNTLCTTFLYTEDKYNENIDTKASYLETNVSGDYTIVTPDASKQKYKVVKNRFYKKDNYDANNWIETDYFMYKGSIVDIHRQNTGYTYSNGHIYNTKVTITNVFSNQFLNFSGTNNDHFYLFSILSDGIIQPTDYTIDLNNDGKIYLNNEDTTYHVSMDNYWVSGDYMKLTPIITPSNATDKSVTWRIQNTDIATVNWDGVVTAWNLGETTVIASTSNDLRAKCIVEVVKDTKYIDIDNMVINPDTITLIVDGDENQFALATVNIEPLFATNTFINWNASYDISNCINIINVGNNQVKITLNGSGNIGIGYLTATSQSGKTAKCLVRVIYQSDNSEDDCPDISHLKQEG